MSTDLATVTYLDHAPEIPPGHVGAPEFLARTGISYRRLDYWSRTGLLHTDQATPGSGYHRTWPVTEIPVAILTRTLAGAGLDIRAAERAARDLLTTGTTTLAGIRLDLPQERP